MSSWKVLEEREENDVILLEFQKNCYDKRRKRGEGRAVIENKVKETWTEGRNHNFRFPHTAS